MKPMLARIITNKRPYHTCCFSVILAFFTRRSRVSMVLKVSSCASSVDIIAARIPARAIPAAQEGKNRSIISGIILSTSVPVNPGKTKIPAMAISIGGNHAIKYANGYRVRVVFITLSEREVNVLMNTHG